MHSFGALSMTRAHPCTLRTTLASGDLAYSLAQAVPREKTGSRALEEALLAREQLTHRTCQRPATCTQTVAARAAFEDPAAPPPPAEHPILIGKSRSATPCGRSLRTRAAPHRRSGSARARIRPFLEGSAAVSRVFARPRDAVTGPTCRSETVPAAHVCHD